MTDQEWAQWHLEQLNSRGWECDATPERAIEVRALGVVYEYPNADFLFLPKGDVWRLAYLTPKSDDMAAIVQDAAAAIIEHGEPTYFYCDHGNANWHEFWHALGTALDLEEQQDGEHSVWGEAWQQ